MKEIAKYFKDFYFKVNLRIQMDCFNPGNKLENMVIRKSNKAYYGIFYHCAQAILLLNAQYI